MGRITFFSISIPDAALPLASAGCTHSKMAVTRCEAVLLVVSEEWLASKWCGGEYQLAKELNKKLFALLIDDLSRDRPCRIRRC